MFLKSNLRKIKSSLVRIKSYPYYYNETKEINKNRNGIICGNPRRLVEEGKVNLNYWRPKEGDNLGDYLSVIVVNYLSGGRLHEEIGETKHLNAIGSILGFGCDDAVVWGSGIVEPRYPFTQRIKCTELDIRAVRGPKTRKVLCRLGKACPEIYGDPAVLMPDIYYPRDTVAEYDISIIPHISDQTEYVEMNRIDMHTADYKKVIDQIVKSKKVISSSLHGIILAEVYGTPAVFLNSGGSNVFKYEDYYLSTKRDRIVVAQDLNEALKTVPMKIPDFSKMREDLKKSFPIDLWR